MSSSATNRMEVRLRRRMELFHGDGAGVAVAHRWHPAADQTALIICDMWDQHWSKGATARVTAMAPRVNDLARRLREHDVLIIHAPSETMDFYRDHPARVRVAESPHVDLPSPLELPDPALPIDDSDGGSDTGEPESYRAWTRQHPAIDIAHHDVISDDGREIYSLLHHTGRQNVLIAGVHTNMCVLNRSFGIKNLARWRLHPVLVRDLTDAMYNPAMPPHVSHERGTELVVEHIERHWCPTTTSDDLRT